MASMARAMRTGSGIAEAPGTRSRSHPQPRLHSVSTTPATGPSSSSQKTCSTVSDRRGVRHHHCRSAASHRPASGSARRARCSSSVTSVEVLEARSPHLPDSPAHSRSSSRTTSRQTPVEPADALADADVAEPERAMQREARLVLREDARLERPEPAGAGALDERRQQRAPDPVAAGRYRRRRRSGRPRPRRPPGARRASARPSPRPRRRGAPRAGARQVSLVPRAPAGHLGLERRQPAGDPLGVDPRDSRPVVLPQRLDPETLHALRLRSRDVPLGDVRLLRHADRLECGHPHRARGLLRRRARARGCSPATTRSSRRCRPRPTAATPRC